MSDFFSDNHSRELANRKFESRALLSTKTFNCHFSGKFQTCYVKHLTLVECGMETKPFMLFRVILGQRHILSQLGNELHVEKVQSKLSISRHEAFSGWQKSFSLQTTFWWCCIFNNSQVGVALFIVKSFHVFISAPVFFLRTTATGESVLRD